MLTPLRWEQNRLLMLDQRVLPQKEQWLELKTSTEVAQAITDMAVRGAPAIGIAAAYGMALAALNQESWQTAQKTLAESRPTAVNLGWALARINALQDKSPQSVLAEAQKIQREDLEMNLAIGKNGAALLPSGANILTICNTGALATGGHGTALGIIRSAFEAKNPIHVWACETRPRQQGLKLTAYELAHEQIPYRCIADSAAASLMKAGRVDVVIAGADHIAANGDTANKIGTYMLAVLAHHHEIPFYIAAPTSTLNHKVKTGADIRIEERDPQELTHANNSPIGPANCKAYNPAFDVTPAELITAIVTETGVHWPPYRFAPSPEPALSAAK
jgi:methylthioribose-1-phosphate isomerase